MVTMFRVGAHDSNDVNDGAMFDQSCDDLCSSKVEVAKQEMQKAITATLRRKEREAAVLSERLQVLRHLTCAHSYVPCNLPFCNWKVVNGIGLGRGVLVCGEAA